MTFVVYSIQVYSNSFHLLKACQSFNSFLSYFLEVLYYSSPSNIFVKRKARGTSYEINYIQCIEFATFVSSIPNNLTTWLEALLHKQYAHTRTH